MRTILCIILSIVVFISSTYAQNKILVNTNEGVFICPIEDIDSIIFKEPNFYPDQNFITIGNIKEKVNTLLQTISDTCENFLYSKIDSLESDSIFIFKNKNVLYEQNINKVDEIEFQSNIENNINKIYNPYSNVDFSTCLKIKGITHEHVITQESFEKCYNRGIRAFAFTNYQPSVPTYPLTGGSYKYIDYSDAATLNKIYKNYIFYGFKDFTDSKGNYVKVSDLVSLPNAEHPNIGGLDCHTNYLGSLLSEAGWGNSNTVLNLPTDLLYLSWRSNNPIIFIDSLFIEVTNYLLFTDKVFGTLNHPVNKSYSILKNYVDVSKGVIKAIEIFNQYYDKNTNEKFLKTWDDFLKGGYRIYGVSVVDWQGYYGDTLIKRDRGCNVLLLDTLYNSLSIKEKSEAALNAYINGCFYSTGFGNYGIKNLILRNEYAQITVDGSPKEIRIITNNDEEIKMNRNVAVKIINNKIKYIRFEVYYNDGDFIYTNPIWIN